MSRQYVVLAGFIALCLAIGWIGSTAVPSSADWDPALRKPDWGPVSWNLIQVWVRLHFLMGIAAWLVWRKDMRFAGVRLSLLFFALQLALSLLWSFLFFGAGAIAWALAAIVLWWIVVALTVWAFFGQSKPAGLLMIPLLAWTSFAAAFNFTVWRLN